MVKIVNVLTYFDKKEKEKGERVNGSKLININELTQLLKLEGLGLGGFSIRFKV